MINKKRDKKYLKGIFQILNLIISIFAFSFLIGLTNVGIVSAEETIKVKTRDNKEIKIDKSYAEEYGMGFDTTKTAAPGATEIPAGTTKIIGSIPKFSDGTQLKSIFVGNKKINSYFEDGKFYGVGTDGKIGPITQEQQGELFSHGIELRDGKIIKQDTDTIVGDWILENTKWGTGAANAIGHITSGLMWAMTVSYAIQFLGGFLGFEDATKEALSQASFWGVMAGKTTYGLIKNGGWLSDWGSAIQTKLGISPSTFSIGTGTLIALIIFISTYKKESVEIITFTCNPWDAPTGGARCEECNKQGILPCSEYQCRALGQSCQLLNPGTSEEKCTWVNRKDVNPPEIQPWDNALLDNYKYNPDNTISPPDRGVKIDYIKSTTKCIKAFSPFTFGIVTNEPAKCKIDYVKKQNFSDMQFWFGGSSTFKYNHTQMMSLPGPSVLKAENLTLENDGEFELFTRCSDANGNSNTANFVFKYCVEKGPDTTPPLIVTTNLLNGMPIAFNQSSVELEVYTNEPSTCKWSHLDQSYDKMEETMICSSSVFEMNTQMLYKCVTTLTGLKNNFENKFYFRCKDNPLLPENERNVNAESYEFTLIGTQPLVIDKVGPNGTIKDSTDTVKVTLTAETSAGYKEGEATCYYSDTGEDDSYIMFFNTESHKHSQELYLVEGDYEYFIKCIDLGGNSDTKIAKFKVETDTTAPRVVRAYHEETYLKLITNEKAECVYDTKSCSYLFEDGIKLTNTNEGKEHYTGWNTQTNFHVKCKDDFGNQPLPNECSIIVRPIEIYSG